MAPVALSLFVACPLKSSPFTPRLDPFHLERQFLTPPSLGLLPHSNRCKQTWRMLQVKYYFKKVLALQEALNIPCN